VFEWVNADFGAQATVCGGGRYDGMVEQLGGQATPGFGFAMGVERLIQILQEQQASSSNIDSAPDVFIISVGQQARSQALQAQQRLTSNDVSVQCHCGDGSMKNQFKKADKSGATLAVIIGESEAEQNQVNIKLLRRGDVQKRPDFEQKIIPQNDVLNVVTNLLESL
jgi:histidyl-tRNA synthetase